MNNVLGCQTFNRRKNIFRKLIFKIKTRASMLSTNEFCFLSVFFSKNSKVCLFFVLLSILYETRFISPQNSIPIYRQLGSCWCEKDLKIRFTCRGQEMAFFQYHLPQVLEMLIKITKNWLHLLLVSQDQLHNDICHKKMACLQLTSLILRRKHVI